MYASCLKECQAYCKLSQIIVDLVNAKVIFQYLLPFSIQPTSGAGQEALTGKK